VVNVNEPVEIRYPVRIIMNLHSRELQGEEL